MSRYTNYSEWPAKAEPISPFTIDEEDWYINDDLDLNDGDYHYYLISYIISFLPFYTFLNFFP